MLTLNLDELKQNLLNKYKACAKNYHIPEEKYMNRYRHSIGVFEMAMELNYLYHFNLDEDLIALAAIYHDYAKFCTIDDYQKIVDKFHLDESILKREFKILHALLGAYVVMDELNVYQEDVFNAISTHTTGAANMSTLQELIYLSDLVENNRKDAYFAKMRNLAHHNFKKAISIYLRDTISYLREDGKKVDEATLEAYEAYKSFSPQGFDKISQVLNCLDKNLTKDLIVYDARGFSPYFDYIIVASSATGRQMEACASYLRDDFEIKGAEIGDGWTLIDLGDIVINIFKEEDRVKYGLDRLYAHLPIYQNEN